MELLRGRKKLKVNKSKVMKVSSKSGGFWALNVQLNGEKMEMENEWAVERRENGNGE